MFRKVAIAVSCAALFACSALGVKNVHMEKAIVNSRDDFLQEGYADETEKHEVVFAVKQSNLDQLEKILFDVSNPKSHHYGQYLTRQQVANLTSNTASTDFIASFLKQHDVDFNVSPFGEYIKAVAPVSVWSKLFATTFYTYTHVGGLLPKIVRAVHYSLPEELVEHTSAVFNTVQMPPRVNTQQKMYREKSGLGDSVTPALLNSYYNIPSNTGNSLASQSLFESLGQYYSPSDLTTFQEQFDLPEEEVAEDIGGYVSDSKCELNANNCIEANLDVQYIMAVAQNTPTTYWYEDAVDSFLAWIQEVAATENPPLVHSISYGAIETEIPSSIGDAFSTEAMKLGVQGVSILVSSGDDGVANFQARSDPKACAYVPSFPASSPYVTAIGATQGAESGGPEVACTSDNGGVITTGGGFSTLFDAPSYQTDAIKDYFASLTALTNPASGYSATGRGYPDVAMAGLNYEVVVGGKTYEVSGTSASSPVVAGMVSLVNAARLKAGKPSLGFLNTAIYQNGDSFTNDITSGENNCCASKVCCDEGFYASTSWDPLTGFGSVDYQKFYNIFYNL